MTSELTLLLFATGFCLGIVWIYDRVSGFVDQDPYRDETSYDVDATAEQYLASRDWQI